MHLIFFIHQLFFSTLGTTLIAIKSENTINSASKIYLILILVLFNSWENQSVAKDETAVLPWLVKPVPSSFEDPMTETFPKVYGLNPSIIAKTPDLHRQDTANIHLFFEQSQYQQVSKMMHDDADFSKSWKRLVRQVKGMLAYDGMGQLENVSSGREIHVLAFRLLRCSLYYRMTGDPQVGRFLKSTLLNASKLPLSFWIYNNLRKYDKHWPQGQLETAILSRSMSTALVWGYELFSESEITTIRNALRTKGLYPMLRYLQTVEKHNNFLPAIASGAMITAVALDDSLAQEQSLSLLIKWKNLVEDDGSYGEQISYFNYACSHFAKGLMALGRKRIFDLGKTFPQLNGSLAWQLAHYSINDQGFPVRINFGDDDYQGGAPNGFSTHFLTMVSNQGLGTWMLEHLSQDKAKDDAYTMISKIIFAGLNLPTKVNPAILPLTQGFDNGIGIIRSSWTMNQDTVISIRSGAGNRTRYSHDAPNRNAIALMYHGDYMLVEPGRASYRSKYRKEYDLKTLHHNTITLENANQQRKRIAHLLTAKQINDQLSVLVSEAAESYPTKPQHVRRSIYYLHDMDIFVVWDLVNTNKPTSIQANWHFGNSELQSTLDKISDQHWQLSKPKTQLDAWFFSNTEISTHQQPGIMHLKNSFYPGDPGEGEMGNAFELQISSKKAEENLIIISIFSPQKTDSLTPVDIQASFTDKKTALITIKKGLKSTQITLDGKQINRPDHVAALINNVPLNGSGKIIPLH